MLSKVANPMDAFVNNIFVDDLKATIGINDLAIQRGYGVFDFFRTQHFVPLFLEDYLNRLFHSASILRLAIPHSKAEIALIIKELIRRNGIATSGIRLVLTGGYSEDSYHIGRPNFIITQKAIELPSEEIFLKGLNIITHDYKREFSAIKSINYLTGIYLQQKISESKADEVLYKNNGNILEFPRANVFIVTQNDTVVTPAEGVLYGITRKKVLEIAQEKYKVEQRVISVAELYQAKEVFFTSTTKRILPVLSVDGYLIGNGEAGEVTKSLYDSFLQMENRLFGHS